MSVQILEDIPVQYDLARLSKELQLERLRGRIDEVDQLIEDSYELLDPKALYIYLQVQEISGFTVRLETGDIVNGAILTDKIKCTQTISPYVVTIGSRLEEMSSQLSNTNLLKAWLLDGIGNHALTIVLDYVQKIVEEKLKGTVSNFNPGSGSGEFFGVDQQKVIFRILSPEDKIGVRLTQDYLMIPRKSVSGIFASTEEKYIACQHCPRKKCDSRKVPFKGEYRPAHAHE